FLLGAVAEPPIEDHSPGNSHKTEQPEGSSPIRKLFRELDDDRRRKSAAEPAGRPDKPLNHGALAVGKPPGQNAANAGGSAGLAETEQESHRHHSQDKHPRLGIAH